MLKQSSMVKPNNGAGFHLTELAWGALIIGGFMCWIIAGAFMARHGVDVDALSPHGFTMRPENVVLN